MRVVLSAKKCLFPSVVVVFLIKPRGCRGCVAPTSWFRQKKISEIIGWIAVESCADIHDPEVMFPTDFVDQMTFPLAPPAG